MYKVYGKPDCRFCELAKDALERRSEPYQYVDVTEDKESLTFLRNNNFKSVPQIYHNEKHIGGFQELQQFLEENK